MLEIGRSNFLRDLNREQKRLVVNAWPYILGYMVLDSAPITYLDIYYYDQDVAYAWAGFLSWGMGYFLLLLVMQQGGLFSKGKISGIGTYFALGLATGILVVLALVVLIIPGLYLLMRWLPVYARALTSFDEIGNTMRWSWDATERFQKPLGIAMIGPVLCYAISAGSLYLYDGSSWTAYIISSIAANLAISLARAWLTVLGVAAFATLTSFMTDDREPI